jgi:putative transposase
MKYSSTFPSRFENVEAVVEFGNQYFDWYNNEHRHSGIAYLTPAQVHAGEADAELTVRHNTKLAAWAEHPERFVRGIPRRETLAAAVYINPPEATPSTTKSLESPASSTEVLH